MPTKPEINNMRELLKKLDKIRALNTTKTIGNGDDPS